MMLDEVSHVLQHFQPKPDFALTDFQRQQQQLIGRRRKRSSDNDRHQSAVGFSSVQYDKGSHKLRLTYLHNPSYLLKFNVLLVRSPQFESNDDDDNNKENEAVRRQICVTFVRDGCSNDNIPSDCIESLNECCTALSSTNDTSTCSLFSILSSLLLTLQTLPHTTPITVQPPVTPVTPPPSPSRRMVMDLAVLLLRCAAASRRSATLCAPIPPQFYNHTNEGGRVARIHHILPYTDLRERCSSSSSSSGQQRRRQVVPPSLQQTVIGRSEHNFRTFLLSLPWITGTATTVRTTKQDGPTTCICLNLDMGDPSPHFNKRAQEHGTLTVFHGSKPDNIWSILNYGLLELSGTNLVENGAMMGKGIYTSTSYDVAAFFAKQNASVSNHTAPTWRHAALRRLLPIPAQDHFTNDTTISCFAIFEATILAPHTNNNNGDSATSTRRDGTYFVVPNGDDVRLTKLHLTFQIGRRTTEPLELQLVPSWVFVILLAVGVAYLLQMYA